MKVPLAQLKGYLLAFIGLAGMAVNTSGHTLPISYLTIVPSDSRIHLELTINPFELNFISEFDANKDGRLESAELKAADVQLTHRVLAKIRLMANGTALVAESAGVAAEPVGHHLTIRAHFPVAEENGPLVVDSQMATITTASHLTEVTFGKAGESQLARLDAQRGTATFERPNRPLDTGHVAASPSRGAEQSPQPTAKVPTPPPEQASAAFLVVFGLAFIPLVGVFVALLMFAPKHLRDDPVQH